MRNLKIFIFLSSVLVLLNTSLIAQEDFKLFNEAMELRIQREWDEALGKYELLKLKYPESKYVDDVEFWSAYILEEQGKESQAFTAYEEMKNKYPNSTWVDDATRHQISLAEKFVKQGQVRYKEFLTKNLDSPNKNVKYQAALSLGKLGDNRAIPVLKEMSNNGDKDMRSMGNSILQKFDRSRQQNQPKLKPMPIRPPKTTTDKKNDDIKKPPRFEPKKQRQTPTQKPDIKSIRPKPKQQPRRSTPTKKSTPPKKSKISQLFDLTSPDGNYVLAFQIEDLNSSRMGVFKVDLAISDSKCLGSNPCFC